jgi:hypothetical protein
MYSLHYVQYTEYQTKYTCILYRITAVLKVETYITTIITVSLIGRAVILVIMYVETFKTAVIVIIGNVIRVVL